MVAGAQRTFAAVLKPVVVFGRGIHADNVKGFQIPQEIERVAVFNIDRYGHGVSIAQNGGAGKAGLRSERSKGTVGRGQGSAALCFDGAAVLGDSGQKTTH
jgi:hypothetical protein